MGRQNYQIPPQGNKNDAQQMVCEDFAFLLLAEKLGKAAYSKYSKQELQKGSFRDMKNKRTDYGSNKRISIDTSST